MAAILADDEVRELVALRKEAERLGLRIVDKRRDVCDRFLIVWFE